MLPLFPIFLCHRRPSHSFRLPHSPYLGEHVDAHHCTSYGGYYYPCRRGVLCVVSIPFPPLMAGLLSGSPPRCPSVHLEKEAIPVKALLTLQMGPVYPLSPADWRPRHILLSPDQAYSRGTRDGRVDLCGHGGGSDHPAQSGSYDPRDAGGFLILRMLGAHVDFHSLSNIPSFSTSSCRPSSSTRATSSSR